MRSSTNSKGPRLVRIAVPCAQPRVAIEMHSRTNGAKQAISTKPRETSLCLCHSLEHHHCSASGESLAAVVDPGVVYDIVLIGSKFVLLHAQLGR